VFETPNLLLGEQASGGSPTLLVAAICAGPGAARPPDVSGPARRATNAT